MGRLRKALRLPARDRGLLARAWAIELAVRSGLWILPFGALRRRVVRYAHVSSRPAGDLTPERAAWAISSAASLVPFATCLTRAFAAEVLLGRAGIPTRLSIGVDPSTGSLRAHAWLESEGRIVTGDHDLARFTVLPPIDGERP